MSKANQTDNKTPEWVYFSAPFSLCFEDAPTSGNEVMGECIGDVIDRCCPPKSKACKHIHVEDNRDPSFKVYSMVMYCRIPAPQAAMMSEADVRKQLQQALDETVEFLETKVAPEEGRGRLLKSASGVMLGSVTRSTEPDSWYQYCLEHESEEMYQREED
jgi:hypothetical protein